MGIFQNLAETERPHHLTFCGAASSETTARTVLFGAPFDATTSFRPGARFAPADMRLDSWGLETYSPRYQKDLEDLGIFDAGDLELPMGSVTDSLDMVDAVVKAILNAQKFPVMIGGEHSLTLGAVRAALASYPDLHVLHLDAHTDLRDDYLGVRFSHACVIKRLYELLGKKRIHSFGIRSGLKEEFAFAANNLDFHPFTLAGIEKINFDSGVPYYLTVDLDVLDPSFFPGTGTPEPEGASYAELLKALETFSKLRLVGADFMELAPRLDHSGMSTAVACKVLREFLAMRG